MEYKRTGDELGWSVIFQINNVSKKPFEDWNSNNLR
jgi:hypothetical protein